MKKIYKSKCPYCGYENKVAVPRKLEKKCNKKLLPRYCTECGRKITYSLLK